jgi:hypothetical protein
MSMAREPLRRFGPGATCEPVCAPRLLHIDRALAELLKQQPNRLGSSPGTCLSATPVTRNSGASPSQGSGRSTPPKAAQALLYRVNTDLRGLHHEYRLETCCKACLREGGLLVITIGNSPPRLHYNEERATGLAARRPFIFSPEHEAGQDALPLQTFRPAKHVGQRALPH